jgi:phosphoglycerate dehydrogenase-like enzyme
MARQRLVAVSYPVDDEFIRINTEVVGGDARLAFLAALDEDGRQAALREAEALIGLNLRRELPAGVWQEAAALQFLQLVSAGADHLDFAAIPGRLILASNVGAYSAPIAEHVMALALALARRLRQRHDEMARGEFNQWQPLLTLDGMVCAILGYGGIGAATAALMRGFGARIHAVNTSGATSDPVEFAGTLADLDQVLGTADVLVVALPLTTATRGLIGARELALMKPAAILVNVSRAAIVDERALFEHLRDHPEFCAGLDTWWHEPSSDGGFRMDYPFLGLPNVIGSPHNSGIVPGVLPHAVRRAAENTRRFLRGEAVTGLIRRADYLQ